MFVCLSCGCTTPLLSSPFFSPEFDPLRTTQITRITQTIEDVNSYQTTIASAVEEQTATTSEISRTVTDAATGSASIAAGVEAVAEASQSSLQGIGESQRAAVELAELSARLRDLVGKFTL